MPVKIELRDDISLDTADLGTGFGHLGFIKGSRFGCFNKMAYSGIYNNAT